MARKFLTPITPPALSTDPSGASAGAIYYNIVDSALRIYNGATWSAITSGSSSASSLQVLDTDPLSPVQGDIYFNTQEKTVKAYNGNIWYDVAGPKEMLDHSHYAGDGVVKDLKYGVYVGDNLTFMDGGGANATFNDTIDGGNA